MSRNNALIILNKQINGQIWMDGRGHRVHPNTYNFHSKQYRHRRDVAGSTARGLKYLTIRIYAKLICINRVHTVPLKSENHFLSLFTQLNDVLELQII
ncbi:unnamed protein product [Onchocerca flexuosa]|uniref:Uncharacterized protein n=1 Tax=Onchocerca flexuosa TaxID=387005 RepID=A0A183H2M2_9BILA|nr:unnamed protein product [Onchocerca flexuosa]